MPTLKKHEIHLIINNNFENRLESREVIIYFPTRCPVHCTPSLSIVAARKESVCLFVFSFTYFWTEVRQQASLSDLNSCQALLYKEMTEYESKIFLVYFAAFASSVCQFHIFHYFPKIYTRMSHLKWDTSKYKA